MNFLRTEGLFTSIVFLVAIAVFSAGFVIGCTKKTTAGVPGTAGSASDSFDQYAYSALVEYKAVIDQSKIEFANGDLPAGAKGIINQAIGIYDQADGFWQRYHSTGGTSVDAVGLEGEITADLAQLAGYIVQLKAMGAAQKANKNSSPAPAASSPPAKP